MRGKINKKTQNYQSLKYACVRAGTIKGEHMFSHHVFYQFCDSSI